MEGVEWIGIGSVEVWTESEEGWSETERGIAVAPGIGDIDHVLQVSYDSQQCTVIQ